MEGPGTLKRIGGIALLTVLSPAILIYVVVQIPFSILDQRRRVRRQKSFAAKMASAGRLISWPELRLQLNASSQGTLIEEDAEDDLYNVWWTLEDIATLSPHPCCFETSCPETSLDMEGFRTFFEWCRSRFTSPESGTALLVDVRKDFWSFFESTKGRPCVLIKRLP
jgi:hypothetical protein